MWHSAKCRRRRSKRTSRLRCSSSRRRPRSEWLLTLDVYSHTPGCAEQGARDAEPRACGQCAPAAPPPHRGRVRPGAWLWLSSQLTCSKRRERAPLVDVDREQQRQLDQQLDFNTNIIVEREEAIREIESAMCGDAWRGTTHMPQDGSERDLQGPERAHHRAGRAPWCVLCMRCACVTGARHD